MDGIRGWIIVGSALVVSLGWSAMAGAGGLYIPEESSATNIAYGGVEFMARQDDASVVFSNPAGMTGLEKDEIQAGGTLLYLYAPFSPGSDNTVEGNDGRATELVGLGNVDYVRKLNDDWTFGLHAGNYFGLLLNWGSQWVGQYTGTQAIVIAPQIQPTLAYKINDQWSVGAGLGLTLGYLKDKVDVYVPPGDNGDGKFRYSDTDFAVQPNLGVMWQPTESTRIGLRYLVETELKFKDDPSYDEVNDIELGNGRELGLDMTMPQSLKLGLWQKVSDKWAVLGNVGWEDWSEFGEIGFDITDSNLNGTVKVETEDTWHVGIGGEYQKTDKLMYTMGASWDSSWQRDNNRTALVPIGTVYRVGGGFKYKKTEDFEWGSGFSVFYEGDLPIKPVDQGQPEPGTFSGEYENVVLYWLTIFGSWR